MKQELLLQHLVFFPKICFFCKNWRKTVKRKIFTPHIITTTSTEKRIKDAAKLRMDHDALGQVCETDLIAKQLMMHRQCYIDYTRCLEEQSQDVDKDDNNDGQRKMKGDFDQVKDFIQDAIIESKKPVSITAVHRIYGTGYGHEHEKVYRNRLKSKIVDEFGDEILFLNVDGQTSEVIVSRAALDSTTVVKDKNAVLKQAAEYLREEIMSYAANYKAS